MANYKVKHYWRDGASSVWEADEKLDREVFEYLKKNYHSFVEKRPKSLSHKNHKILFEYKDSKDSFGRDITDIVFDISILKVSNQKRKIYFFIFLLLFILGSIFFYSIDSKENNNKPNSSKNSILVKKESSEKLIDKDWNFFVTDWNKKLPIDDDKFKLKENNSKYIITKLNEWLEPFEDFKKIDLNVSFEDFEKKIKKFTKKKNMNRYFEEIQEKNQ